MKEITWLILSSIFSLIPIVLIKQYNTTDNYIYLILTMICYLILTICYINILKENISSKYTILQIMQILIVTLIGIFYFNDTFDYIKILGIIFALVAVYLLF